MSLEEYIKKHYSKNEKVPCALNIHTRSFNKGDILLDYHDPVSKLFFLRKGFVELVSFDGGQEKILDFYFKNKFITAYSSYLLGEPSFIRITALEKCKVDYFNFSEFKMALDHSLELNQIARIETEKLLVRVVQREKDFLIKSAEERYIDIILNSPEIIKKVPVNRIAKFLGIHPESLSRIRNKLKKI